MTGWRDVSLGDVCELKRGYDLPRGSRLAGTVSVISSSGPTGFHTEAKVRAPGVVTGRYGTLGEVFYITEDFWPLNTALYVRDFKGNNPRYVAALLESMDLARYDGAAAVPGLNRNQLHTVRVRIPSVDTQRVIASVLTALDDLIENSRRRVAVLEEMVRATYRDWFVRFHFPGWEDAPLVDSPLGPIPAEWEVRTVSSIASNERHAISSGPFGSKLGRKDYLPQGVPVIRGVNLRLGGGFDESGLVFVAEEKAEDLRSSWVRRGDIVITQRGTLGQVGLIHSRSRFDRYVLSQSQMKVTVDARVATPSFFYAQMSSEGTTQRFIAQAMVSGVPHVNLQLLRDFPILLPPKALQDKQTKFAAPLQDLASVLAGEISQLVAIRDFLLPKLVSGQIDVSRLDLDALVEGAVA